MRESNLLQQRTLGKYHTYNIPKPVWGFRKHKYYIPIISFQYLPLKDAKVCLFELLEQYLKLFYWNHSNFKLKYNLFPVNFSICWGGGQEQLHANVCIKAISKICVLLSFFKFLFCFGVFCVCVCARELFQGFFCGEKFQLDVYYKNSLWPRTRWLWAQPAGPWHKLMQLHLPRPTWNIELSVKK